MTVVVKMDERREGFDARKVRRSVERAARGIDLPADRVERLARAIEKAVTSYAKDRDEVRTSDLREMILASLDTAEPQAARSWRDYDRGIKGRS